MDQALPSKRSGVVAGGRAGVDTVVPLKLNCPTTAAKDLIGSCHIGALNTLLKISCTLASRTDVLGVDRVNHCGHILNLVLTGNNTRRIGTEMASVGARVDAVGNQVDCWPSNNGGINYPSGSVN